MGRRPIIALVAGGSVLGFILLLFLAYHKPAGELPSAPRGEEVYASHDCTDCHLSAPVLKLKREKHEPGLIRVRKDLAALTQFLQSDKRHETYSLISPADQADLIEYLKSLAY